MDPLGVGVVVSLRGRVSMLGLFQGLGLEFVDWSFIKTRGNFSEVRVSVLKKHNLLDHSRINT